MTMTSVTTSRSVFERLSWKSVWYLFQEWLIGRFASSEGEEANLVCSQIDLGADEAVQPVPIDEEGMSQDADVSLVVGTADVDDGASWLFLQVESPTFGKWPAWRRRLDTSGVALPSGGDVSGGSGFQASKRAVLESRPDLGLPTSVEALDGCLEAMFGRHRKYGSHLQAQTDADDASDGIAVLSGAGETVVVVELSVGWKAYFPPMFQQGIQRGFGGNGPCRPSDHQATIERNSGQNRQMRSSANRQALDGVEAVEFDVPGRQVGQVPASRWGRSAGSFASVQRPSPFEDASDSANRGTGVDLANLHLLLDRGGAVFAQRAFVFEPLPNSEHLLLDCRIGTPGGFRRPGTAAPVDPVESFSLGTFDPALHGAQRDNSRSWLSLPSIGPAPTA